jgi:hypothetical protein
MACGCKKKKKAVSTVVETSSTTVDTETVYAMCENCQGLLLADSGEYLPMHTGDYFQVTMTDVYRWRSQGWVIKVRS